jgi:cytochrome c oxidase accessory protein FixG
MVMGVALPTPTEDVLSTMKADGGRRWLRPRPAPGRFLAARRIVAWSLVALFVVLPFLRIHGRPAVLFDVLHWRLLLMGKLFLPSDTILLAILLVGATVALFLLTAILGRAWCGWACPQTVYMEFLFRPIERFFDGKPKRGGAPAREPSGLRMMGKYAAFVLASLVLGNVFLSYFVGVDQLGVWMTQSPGKHPGAFFVVALTSGLVFLDFAWFREQTCIVACPYGRLQSVLLDRDSLVVSYDRLRGEPRGPLRSARLATAPTGDCVDCGMCVDTCPTGIDIRGGLRMECLACAQCIDACDAVMDKLHRPRGLIGYSTQARREKGSTRFLRPRVFIYGGILAGMAALLLTMGLRAQSTDVILLRGLGMPFTVTPEGDILNPARVKITNREAGERVYTLAPADGETARLLMDDEPLRVGPGGSLVRTFLVEAPPSAFTGGHHEARLRIRDGHGFDRLLTYRLLGPASGGAP